MARNVGVQVDGTGPVIASISGRSDLVGTIRVTSDGIVLRLDDMFCSEFWAEVRIDLASLQTLAARVQQERNEAEGPLIDLTEFIG